MLNEIIVGFIIVILILRFFEKGTNALYKCDKSLNGKTAIVTGGTAGIGLQVALDFARRGAKVIVACPFEEEGEDAQKYIIQQTGNEKVYYKHLNLASLKSVRDFAADILKNEDKLHLLINNAGVGIPGDFLTEDGLNFIMQVNYFGHVLLTILLLPVLKKSGPARIVNTSSLLHRLGEADFRYWAGDNQYSLLIRVYSNSKYCFLPFSRELTKKLYGTQVTINSIDPGIVGTKIYECGNFAFLGGMIRIFFKNVFKTPEEGAQTIIFAAIDDSVEGKSGEFFRNCEMSRAKARSAYDDAEAKRVFDESVKLVKISDQELGNCLWS